MHIGNRVLWGTLVLSLFAHGVLYAWLHVQARVPVGAKHGVVSVSFVESVTHDTHPPSARAPTRKSDTVNPHPTQAAPQPEAPPPDPNAMASAAGGYGVAVATLVARKKIYPQEAIDREQEGKVVIGITLERDGTVAAANLEEPSAFQILNEAALKTVQAVGRFPPVPDLLSVPIHLHVPIVYRIERN